MPIFGVGAANGIAWCGFAENWHWVMGMGCNCVDCDAFGKEAILKRWVERDGHFM